MDLFTSALKMFSVGLVTEDKALDSKTIYATPVEVLSELDGELRAIPVELFAAGVDLDNKNYSVKIEGTNSLPCDHLSFSDNKMTAPDVRRGEQVIIWRLGDSDKYFWTTLGRDQHLRRLETVIWAFSNISEIEEDVASLSADNAYYIEVSTHTKQITIKTNKNDGEPFAYTVQLNAKDGNFTVQDDVGNYVQLDSANTTIDSTNKEGTYWRLNKKNIYGYAPDSMFLKAVNSMELECTDFLLKASNSITTETTTASHTAKSIVNKADTMTNKAKTITNEVSESITNDSPLVICTGLLKTAGLAAVGGGGGSYTCEISVPMKATEGFAVEGGIESDTATITTINYGTLTQV